MVHGPDAETVGEAKLPVPTNVAEAIRTLIRWSGDDPAREGLFETPERVARAWKEYCRGYQDDPAYHLSRIFHEVGGYDDIVLLKDIPFQSHCEHRQGAHRLSARQLCGRHFETGPRAPRLRQPIAGAGTVDLRSR
jgi:hypothetical protein